MHYIVRGGGGGISSSTTNVQHPPGWCDGSHIAPERPPHTSLLVERRQSDGANQCMGWLGVHDGQRPMGKFGLDAGVTPLLFFEGHSGIFNDHRESGPRFNIASEGRCFSMSNAVLNLAVKYVWKKYADWWLHQNHVPSIANLRAHGISVWKGLYRFVKNQFVDRENEWRFWLQEPDSCTLLALCCYFIGRDPKIWWKIHAVYYFQGQMLSCKLILPKAKCKLLDSAGIMMKMIIRLKFDTVLFFYLMVMRMSCNIPYTHIFFPSIPDLSVLLSASLPEHTTATWTCVKGDWLLCVIIIKQKIKTRTACLLTP